MVEIEAIDPGIEQAGDVGSVIDVVRQTEVARSVTGEMHYLDFGHASRWSCDLTVRVRLGFCAGSSMAGHS